MSLLKIFQGSKIQSAWMYQSSDVIWRLLPSSNGILIGEARNAEKKQVSFFCLDARTGIPRWQNLSFDEQWWISIEAVHGNILFFHEFASPDMPDHKKIRSVDLATGTPLWVNDEVQLMFANEKYAYVSKTGFEQRHFYEADLKTGTIVREITAEELSAQQPSGQIAEGQLQFPVQLDATQTVVIKGAVAKAIQTSIFSELIEHEDKIIVGYYDTQQGKNGEAPVLNQHLVITDSGGRELYRDTINTGVSYPMPDSFLCMDDHLYYIKNKNVLVAAKLSEQ